MILRECNKCHKSKPLSEYQIIYSCRDCRNAYKKNLRKNNLEKQKLYDKQHREERKHNLKLFLTFLHSGMRSRVVDKDGKHPTYKGLPICTKDEFIKFGLQNKNLKLLYKQWEEKEHERMLTPSVDRIINEKGYSIDNIQFITTIENIRKK